MSMIHLRPRKQQIELHKAFTKDKKVHWNIDGKVLEIVQPKEAPGCFASTKHHGIFFDGEEMMESGNNGNRFGFIRDDHHYQVLYWGFNFTHTKARSKNGKFILIIDGWESETGIPINQFYRAMYKRVLVFGFLLLVLSIVGILAVAYVQSAIISSMLSRTFLIFLPLSFYYLYVGFIGTVKFNSRMKLDEVGDPWWDVENVVPNTDDDAEQGNNDNNNNNNNSDDNNSDDGNDRGGSKRDRRRSQSRSPVAQEPGLTSLTEQLTPQPSPQRAMKEDATPLIAFD